MWQNSAYRQHQADAQQRSWRNPISVMNRLTAARRCPNKLEERLIDLLAEQFPQFKYNGNFELGVSLGGLIPDFVNVNGQKEVIELFGDYYHSPEVTNNDWRRSELGKVMAYSSVGYRCLVIWEHNFNNEPKDQVVSAIRKFTKTRR